MIINELAQIINSIIIKLYSNNINFYEILIGLFIFNIIIYSICRLIKESKKARYY